MRSCLLYLSGSESAQVFYFLFISLLSLDIQLSEGEGGIPLTDLNLPHFYACPKSGPGLPTLYVVAFMVLNCLKRQVVCLLVLLIVVELLTITV